MIELTCSIFAGGLLSLYRSRFSAAGWSRNVYALLAIVLFLVTGALLCLSAQPDVPVVPAHLRP